MGTIHYLQRANRQKKPIGVELEKPLQKAISDILRDVGSETTAEKLEDYAGQLRRAG